MILKFYGLDIYSEIPFCDGYALSIEISDKKFFLNCINSLLNNCDTSEKEIGILNDKNILLGLDKDYAVFFDYFNAETIGKTMQTKLIKYICDYYKGDIDNKYKLNELSKPLYNFIEKSLQIFDIQFDMTNEIALEEILKLFKVSPVTDYSSISEKFNNYIDIIGELKFFKLLVFVNSKSFFSDEELSKFIKNCAYKNIKLLLIDSKITDNLLDNEIKYTIDQDLFVNKIS